MFVSSVYLSRVDSYFVRDSVDVILEDDKSYIGYTLAREEGKNIQIYLSLTNPIFDTDAQGHPIPEDMKKLMICGVDAHEILHQIYSPFDEMDKVANTIPEQNRQLFLTVFNIVEDPAVESAAECVFGGFMLKGLELSIQHFYTISHDIDAGIPLNDPSYALLQILNAFIQLGDRGPVKGKFVSKEGQDYFDKALPVFQAAVAERNGIKRTHLCKELFDILAPLASISKSIDFPSRSSNAHGSGNGEDIPSSQTEISGQNASSESSDKSGADERNYSQSAKNAPASFEEIDAAIEEMKKAFGIAEAGAIKQQKADEKNEKAKVGDYELDSEYIQHVKSPAATLENIDAYKSCIEANKSRIAALRRQFERIFANDTGGKIYSEQGKIAINRVASGKLYKKIAQTRLAPKYLSDMAVYLLIDSSGSMAGEKIRIARESAICLYEALASLGIPVYVTGFSGLVKSVHTNYITWHSHGNDKYKLAKIEAGCNNYDYFAIREAALQLNKHSSKHKLLIVISDGMPCYCQFVSDAQKATSDEVREARRSGVSLVGIAVQPSVKDAYIRIYGRDCVFVNEVEDLFTNICSALKTSLTKKSVG